MGGVSKRNTIVIGLIFRVSILIIFVWSVKNLIANHLSHVNFGHTIITLMAFAVFVEIILFLLTDIEKNNRYLVAISLFFSLLLVEVYLQFGRNDYKVYSEINEGFYSSRYTYNHSANKASLEFNDLRKVLFNTPNSPITIEKEEFRYVYEYNDLGLVDKVSIPLKKDSIKQRVIALGDSFTEGVGAPMDSSWVNLLGLKMNQKFPDLNLEVINAGRSGNDPIFSYKMLTYLLDYQPDLVLLAINKTELSELFLRGGFERFNGETLQLKEGPWWEFLFASSYIVRYYIKGVLKYDYNFISLYNGQKNAEAAYELLIETLNKFNALAKEEGFRFMVILQPHEPEFYNGQLELDEAFIKINIDKEVPVLNLLPCMTYKMQVANSLPSDCFWKLDAHCNSKGYNLMAECLMEMLAPPEAE